jgi:hypothetical protein
MLGAREEGRKVGFLEKKQQKTFDCWVGCQSQGAPDPQKSFASFLQKGRLFLAF